MLITSAAVGSDIAAFIAVGPAVGPAAVASAGRLRSIDGSICAAVIVFDTGIVEMSGAAEIGVTEISGAEIGIPLEIPPLNAPPTSSAACCRQLPTRARNTG